MQRREGKEVTVHCGNCQQWLWPESKCEKRKVGRCGLGCGQGQTTWSLEFGTEGLGLSWGHWGATEGCKQEGQGQFWV